MAELFRKRANATCDFGCYSERGIMSYFMFVELPNRVGDFLANLQFAVGCENPFRHLNGESPQATIFSELDFGNEGFGKPDGAIFVDGPSPAMLLIEVKLNETYKQSCTITKNNDYNSTIKGQLELKWRLAHLFGTTDLHADKKHRYVRETPELKAVYGARDRFYRAKKRRDESKHGSWRRLKVVDGVAGFLAFLKKCEDRIYFYAITADADSPFDCEDESLMPRCGSASWQESKAHFCWLPTSVLTTEGDDVSISEASHV